MLRGGLPYFYDTILRPLLNTHNYNTRSGNYRHPMLHSEIERRSLAHQLVLLFESVHTDAFDTLSVTTAANKYKKHLLSLQM